MPFCHNGVTEVVSERSKLTIKWSPCLVLAWHALQLLMLTFLTKTFCHKCRPKSCSKHQWLVMECQSSEEWEYRPMGITHSIAKLHHKN